MYNNFINWNHINEIIHFTVKLPKGIGLTLKSTKIISVDYMYKYTV